jgi:hypothetical protein
MTNVDFNPKPYRVERRLHVGQPWMLVGEADSHEEALRMMRESVEQYEGFARAIVQHVIERFDAGQLPRSKRRHGRVHARA